MAESTIIIVNRMYIIILLKQM